MRFNDHALRQVARTVHPDKEGRLNYRAPKDSTYIVRWKHNCVEFPGKYEEFFSGGSRRVGTSLPRLPALPLAPSRNRMGLFTAFWIHCRCTCLCLFLLSGPTFVSGYKERWFKLKGNLLFFFRTNDHGSMSDSDVRHEHMSYQNNLQN